MQNKKLNKRNFIIGSLCIGGIFFTLYKFYKCWLNRKIYNNFINENKNFLNSDDPLHNTNEKDKLDELEVENKDQTQLKNNNDNKSDPLHNTNEKDKLDELEVENDDQTQLKNKNDNKDDFIEFSLIKKLLKELTHISIDYLMKVYKYIEQNNLRSGTSVSELMNFKEKSK